MGLAWTPFSRQFCWSTVLREASFSGKVSAGYVTLTLTVGESYGIPRSELLAAAALDANDVRDPSALVSSLALDDLLRFIVARTGDAGLGMRLAKALDLRTLGFWGYAILSSQTLRQRFELHQRYRSLRGPAEYGLRIEGDAAIVDIGQQGVQKELLPILMDWTIGSWFVHHRKRPQSRGLETQVWLGYPERPHHKELIELLGGRVTFDAPSNRLRFAAVHLDTPLPGADPHLARLAVEQLEAQLTQVSTVQHHEILDDVRRRLVARLGGDASLDRIARDLRVSARTLRRQLDALGASFQGLLEDVRRVRAIEYLVETNEPVEQVAARLGYGDPSNFRRAFRRWTGKAPTTYRAERRSSPLVIAHPSSDSFEPPTNPRGTERFTVDGKTGSTAI